MAWQLFRLGRWSFLHRKLVAGIWVVLLLLGVLGASTLNTQTSDSFELDGIESTEAFSLISERSGESADGATARIVFEAPEGQSLTDPANQAAVADAIASAQTEHVASATDPFTTGTISENGRAGTTALPVPSTSAGATTRIVSSRSEPTSSMPSSDEPT